MPEGRPAPYKFFPKPGAALSVTFGEPVPAKDIQEALDTLVREKRLPEAPHSSNGGLSAPPRPQEEEQSGIVAEHGWLGGPVSHAINGLAGAQHPEDPDMAREVARVRSAVTAVIQREVERLGSRVMGNLKQ